MTFEDDFPSLKNNEETFKIDKFYRETTIERFCLDKKIVEKELSELERDALGAGMTSQLEGAIKRLRMRLLK